MSERAIEEKLVAASRRLGKPVTLRELCDEAKVVVGSTMRTVLCDMIFRGTILEIPSHPLSLFQAATVTR